MLTVRTTRTGPSARPIAALVVAALVGVPCHAAMLASERHDLAAESGSPPVRVAVEVRPTLPPGAIRASALHWASAESRRLVQTGQSGAAAASDRCSASVVEKLAWLYAVVGGSILLVYGPQEKEGGVWTMDGKSETVAGAAALVLSFGLLRDIRKKGR